MRFTLANNIPLIFLSSLGEYTARAALALRRLFHTQYQPLPSQVENYLFLENYVTSEGAVSLFLTSPHYSVPSKVLW